ncbi:hypothetical protein M0802_003712 [Mischocyttarus mexicanus]|nr:hypothetical protein M0802_003712 [Mischocyttarus mexicanus]
MVNSSSSSSSTAIYVEKSVVEESLLRMENKEIFVREKANAQGNVPNDRREGLLDSQSPAAEMADIGGVFRSINGEETSTTTTTVVRMPDAFLHYFDIPTILDSLFLLQKNPRRGGGRYCGMPQESSFVLLGKLQTGTTTEVK